MLFYVSIYDRANYYIGLMKLVHLFKSSCLFLGRGDLPKILMDMLLGSGLYTH